MAGPSPKLIPMQPRPRADTSKLLFPSFRFCIVSPRMDSCHSSSFVLFVAYFFQPFDDLAVERLLNSDVRHPRRRRSSVPMPLVRRAPDDVARLNFHFGLPFTLHPAAAVRDDQRLA